MFLSGCSCCWCFFYLLCPATDTHNSTSFWMILYLFHILENIYTHPVLFGPNQNKSLVGTLWTGVKRNQWTAVWRPNRPPYSQPLKIILVSRKFSRAYRKLRLTWVIVMAQNVFSVAKHLVMKLMLHQKLLMVQILLVVVSNDELHDCLLSIFYRIAPPTLVCPIIEQSLHTRGLVVKLWGSCKVKRNNFKDTLCFGLGQINFNCVNTPLRPLSDWVINRE